MYPKVIACISSLLTLFISFSGAVLFAENSTSIAITPDKYTQANDSLRAGKHRQKAGKYLEWENYDSALYHYRQTQLLLGKNNLNPEYIETAIDIAICKINLGEPQKANKILHFILSDSIHLAKENREIIARTYEALSLSFRYSWELDESISYQKKTVSIRKNIYGDEHPRYARSLVKLGYLYTFFPDMLKTAEGYFMEAINIQMNASEIQQVDLAESYKELGGLYYDMEDYVKSLEYLKKAASIYRHELPENHPAISHVANYLGNTYFVMDLHDMALDYYLESFRIKKNAWGEDQPQLAIAYYNLGMIYGEKGDYTKAISCYKKTYQLASVLYGNNHPRIGNLFYNIGIVYSHMNNSDSATYFIRRSLPIFKKGYGETHQYVIDAYNLLGSVHDDNHTYDSAIFYYTKAIEIINQSENNKTHYSGTAYHNLGNVFYKQKEYKKALFYFQKSMTYYASEFNDTLGISNPSIENALHPSKLIMALNDKAGLLYDIYTENNQKNKDELVRSFSTFLLADTLIDEFKKYAMGESQKLELIQKARETYEGAIQVAITFYENNKNNLSADSAIYYLNQALLFCEKSKSALLNGSLKEIRARQYGGIPDSLLAREVEIKKKMANLRNEMLTSASANEISDVKSEILQLNQEYHQLINLFEKNYAFYYKLKYDRSDISVEELQQSILKPGQAILEYFNSESEIYLFLITKNICDIVTIRFDSIFSGSVDHLIRGIKEQNYSQYTKSAWFLYQKLLGPSMNILHAEQINQLLIIPDGILNYIPFEALITESVEHKNDYKKLTYLISDYIINYHYSTGLLAFMQNYSNPVNTNSLIAFAPAFNVMNTKILTERAGEIGVEISNLESLPHAEEEARYIAELWNGKALIGPQASEKNFNTEAQSHDIIHFASHALINHENPMFSKLVFSPEQGKEAENDGLLNLFELYYLNLNADLVVLSACNTGLGKYYKGEGLMSLGRGFMYTGVSNVIMSLWQIPDEATSVIMKTFYEELKKGNSKAESLRLAKLKYMEISHPALAAPYYWSAHILTGNLESAQTGFEKYRNFIIPGILILLIGLIIYKKRIIKF